MTIEQNIAELVQASNKLTGVVDGKIQEIDSKVASAEQKFNGLNDELISNLGFVALNYNSDFLDVHTLAENALGSENTYPIGMGVGGGRNDCFKSEIISVVSGSEPNSRDTEVTELLNFMGIGSARYFSNNFNILKLTVLDSLFIESSGYDFYIPQQQIKRSPSASFMAYIKSVGDIKWRGGSNHEWQQIVDHHSSANPGSYTHIDINFQNAKVGDIFYLALPTITVGHFPKSKKHGNLYNPKTELIRKFEV